MFAIKSQTLTREGASIVRYDDAVWSLTRDQFLAMLGQPGMTRPKAITEVINSLGEFLGVEPELLTKRVIFNALATGELTQLQLDPFAE